MEYERAQQGDLVYMTSVSLTPRRKLFPARGAAIPDPAAERGVTPQHAGAQLATTLPHPLCLIQGCWGFTAWISIWF